MKDFFEKWLKPILVRCTKELVKKAINKIGKANKSHPWRQCPIGEHWVVTHKMKFLYCFILMFSFNLWPSFSDAKENATWIKSSYFRGHDPITKKGHTSKDVEDLGLRLKTHNIRYAYIFAGPFKTDGHLPDYVFSRVAKESIAILKRIYPEIKILPWIGGVQNKTVHLERTEWIKNALADTTRLIKLMPVDGVHLDIEYVLYPENKFNQKKMNANDYGEHWVKFHKELRLALPEALISTVVVSTASGTKPWKHKHTLNEIKELASVVDQMSFMYYETSLMELKVYKDNLKEQIQQIKNLKSFSSNRAQYLIGLGVFSEEKKLQSYRDLGFKNLPLTLKLIQEAEQEIGQKKPIIDGLAIYCEWMITALEWNQLKDHLR
jgi:hypothetical protein